MTFLYYGIDGFGSLLVIVCFLFAVMSQCGKKRSRRSPNTIRYRGLVRHFGRPINLLMYSVAFLRLKMLFGQRWSGFVDFYTYDYYDLSIEEQKVIYKRFHATGTNAINALYLRFKMPNGRWMYHTTIAFYSAFRSEVTIYEPGTNTRSYPIDVEYCRELSLYHLENCPNVQVAYSRDYEIQPSDDKWSCIPRAIFCTVCLLAKVNPCHYAIDLPATFALIKELVENRGSAIRNKTIQSVLADIATKLENPPNNMNQYEPLMIPEDLLATAPIQKPASSEE